MIVNRLVFDRDVAVAKSGMVEKLQIGGSGLRQAMSSGMCGARELLFLGQ